MIEDGVELYLGDCLEVMPRLADKSIDAIICDLPYGTTACAWDSVIPFEPLWTQYKRIIKPRGAIVLFGSQPFTSALVMSNPKWFRYEWIWDKKFAASFARCNIAPMKIHENLLVFSSESAVYKPQKILRSEPIQIGGSKPSITAPLHSKRPEQKTYYDKFPESIIEMSCRDAERGIHPTQKPVDLIQYLVKTYTNPGDTVLDNCFGSCSTGVACLNTARNFIGIEKDPEFFRVGKKRMEEREKELIELGVIPLSYDKIGKDISNYPARSLFEYQQILEMGGYDEQK